MDIKKIVEDLRDCPCGRKHEADIKAVEIAPGILSAAAEILKNNGFPQNILVVADKNTLGASDGILDVLSHGGFEFELKLFDDLRVADAVDVESVRESAETHDGILSVGSGSLNDICRRAAYLDDKEFAIFATAPSMDGFASGTAPITSSNFKKTMPACQPSVIIADTVILAASPNELKAAGFGDIIAKYIGLVDWKISHLVTGEYYCENISKLTKSAIDKMISLADKIQSNDPETAEAIMEALVFTGIAMKLADCVRPASGTEHVLSHYWEIKKLEQGLSSDFHGKKVGVATLIADKIYKQIIKYDIAPHEDRTDWEDVYETYGRNFTDEVKDVNTPTVTSETTPLRIRDNWENIVKIVSEELPEPEILQNYMRLAGAAVSLSDISVEPKLGAEGVVYHPYMRYRMTLMRLIPMLGLPVTIRELTETSIIE